jgi:hypothetical protein
MSAPPPYTVVVAPKSVGISIILTVLLGPLGVFYSSVTGGIVMCIAAVVIGLVTLGFGLPFVWIGSIIWGAVAVNQYNTNLSMPQTPVRTAGSELDDRIRLAARRVEDAERAGNASAIASAKAELNALLQQRSGPAPAP